MSICRLWIRPDTPHTFTVQGENGETGSNQRHQETGKSALIDHEPVPGPAADDQVGAEPAPVSGAGPLADDPEAVGSVVGGSVVGGPVSEAGDAASDGPEPLVGPLVAQAEPSAESDSAVEQPTEPATSVEAADESVGDSPRPAEVIAASGEGAAEAQETLAGNPVDSV